MLSSFLPLPSSFRPAGPFLRAGPAALLSSLRPRSASRGPQGACPATATAPLAQHRAAAALPISTAVAPSAADSPGPQVSAIPHLCPTPGLARHGRNCLRAHVRIVGAPPRAPASTKRSPRPSPLPCCHSPFHFCARPCTRKPQLPSRRSPGSAVLPFARTAISESS